MFVSGATVFAMRVSLAWHPIPSGLKMRSLGMLRRYFVAVVVEWEYKRTLASERSVVPAPTQFYSEPGNNDLLEGVTRCVHGQSPPDDKGVVVLLLDSR